MITKEANGQSTHTKKLTGKQQELSERYTHLVLNQAMQDTGSFGINAENPAEEKLQRLYLKLEEQVKAVFANPELLKTLEEMQGAGRRIYQGMDDEAARTR